MRPVREEESERETKETGSMHASVTFAPEDNIRLGIWSRHQELGSCTLLAADWQVLSKGKSLSVSRYLKAQPIRNASSSE